MSCWCFYCAVGVPAVASTVVGISTISGCELLLLLLVSLLNVAVFSTDADFPTLILVVLLLLTYMMFLLSLL